MKINKVFGIGLESTGTRSLAFALQQIGFNVAHNPLDTDLLHSLSNGLVAGLPFLEDLDGITDIQTVPFYPQFDEEYPGSKFIYTYRDVDSWIASVHKKKTRKRGRIGERQFVNSYRNFVRIAAYGTVQYSESVFRHRHRTHHLSIMDYFKGKDNLLTLRICDGEGWDKLCPFLGVDIPDIEFPYRGKHK